jgi:hypothetical protein
MVASAVFTAVPSSEARLIPAMRPEKIIRIWRREYAPSASGECVVITLAHYN